MNRMTKLIDKDLYVVDDNVMEHNEKGYLGDAVSKLAKFENIHEDLLAKQDEISNELAKLRLEGKTHSVKFKQLLTNKLTNNNTIILFNSYGLNK